MTPSRSRARRSNDATREPLATHFNHETYIQEHEKTKRLSLLLSAALLVVACLVVVFAPEGREIVAHWVGVAIFITSAGVAGYTSIWGRVKSMRLGAGRDLAERDL